MTTIRIAVSVILGLALVAHAGGDHDHEDAHSNDEVHEAPTVAVTRWTDAMELFMEYPVLSQGATGRFIIHLTFLDGFQPVRDGEVTLSFVKGDEHPYRVSAVELLREGIFAPELELAEAGTYAFSLEYLNSQICDTFDIGECVVYATPDDIPYSEHVESGEEIDFLKEQQWKVPFGTAPVEIREIRHAAWAIGEVLPSPNAYVEIIAPVDGIVQVAESRQLALPGSNVARGDVVAAITPPVHGNGWATSHFAYEQAKREYERARRLKERQAISERDFERIQNEYLAMKVGFEAVQGGGTPEVLELKAPLSGVIIEWQVRPGQRVSAGDKLMAIVDPATVWLRVNVYEDDFQQLGRPVGAFVRSNASAGGWSIGQADMKVLTSGGALDPATRTVPVLLEVSNSEHRLRIGESTPVELYSSEAMESPVVPKSSVYEDEGMDVVFVQIGGESFEKRVVTVGPRYDRWVSVLHGLQPGERVVTTGGYFVKLASTSAELGHGHAH